MLHEGDVVVMGNLSSHKVDGVEEAIENAGAKTTSNMRDMEFFDKFHTKF